MLRIWSPQAAGREALTGILAGMQTVCTQEGLGAASAVGETCIRLWLKKAGSVQ